VPHRFGVVEAIASFDKWTFAPAGGFCRAKSGARSSTRLSRR